MEEDKKIKRKKIFKYICKLISYTFIILLMIVASFLIIFILTSKISEKKGEKAPFGLYTIISPSMEPNINVYDVILIKKVNPKTLKIGDVITFKSTNSFFGNTPITHRIIEIINIPNDRIYYRVKGDANATYDKEKVLAENIYGKAILKIPKLGKIQYFLTSKKGWFLIILLPILAIILYDVYKILNLIKLKKELKEMQE